MSKLIVYTDDEGFKWVHEVPADLVDAEAIRYGIRLGPPALTSLNLAKPDEIALNNALCVSGIYDYESMNGRRSDVLGLIRRILPGSDAKSTLVSVVSIFQLASFARDEPF